jgi:hypothetical protein
MHAIIWLGNLKGRDYLEDLGIRGMGIRKIGWEVVEWIYVAKDRDQ